MGFVRDAGDKDSLLNALERTECCGLYPLAFFVSWQGVLTLAYMGFPQPVLDLKQELSAMEGLAPEQPGSMWPKTSLGCLHDKRRLTPDQLATLIRVCRECSGELAGAAALPVDRGDVVVHQCRSLERRLSVQSVEFRQGQSTVSADGWPAPPPEQVARVAAVLAEPEAEDYWFAVSRDGNRRAHYADAHLGVTLVHFIRLSDAAGAVLAAIDRFRRAVDVAVPGMYYWFDDAALHVTLRAIAL